MKAIQINSYGGNEVVEINNNVSEPKIVPGFILVEVWAAGVNPSDWKIRQGLFHAWRPLVFPAILGGDFSGVVKETGAGVSTFKIGDEVYGRALAFGGSSGSFTELVLADVKTTALKPKNISHMEASALPLVGVSAVQALVEHINLKKGEKVLIHGGAGGIGSLAIQIAKRLGTYVFTTVSTDDIDYVKDLGVDEVIDYKNQDFSSLVNNVDAVFDTVGGEIFTKSLMVLKKKGVIVSMGHSNIQSPTDYNLQIISQQTDVTSDRLDKVTSLVESGAIKVTIDQTFPLDEAAKALDYLEHSHHRGKVVLQIK